MLKYIERAFVNFTLIEILHTSISWQLHKILSLQNWAGIFTNESISKINALLKINQEKKFFSIKILNG